MHKFFCLITLCCSTLFSSPAISNELEVQGKRYVNEILKNNQLENSTRNTLQDSFISLSPELLINITKSFFLLRECLPTLLDEGNYLEFGLYKGFSLWFAQQIGSNFVGNNFRYFGFDSFAGLPSQSQDYALMHGAWAPGVYAVGIEEVIQYLQQHGADFSKLYLVPGWFSQNLFQDWSKQFGSIKPSIITIDSDVYESCREILQFFANYLQPGTIILFDDFIWKNPSAEVNNFGERKALKEFLSQRKDVQLIHLFPGGWGYAFMVVSCNGISLDKTIKEKVQALIGEPELPDYPIFVE